MLMGRYAVDEVDLAGPPETLTVRAAVALSPRRGGRHALRREAAQDAGACWERSADRSTASTAMRAKLSLPSPVNGA